jgi:hypothetical protein
MGRSDPKSPMFGGFWSSLPDQKKPGKAHFLAKQAITKSALGSNLGSNFVVKLLWDIARRSDERLGTRTLAEAFRLK